MPSDAARRSPRKSKTFDQICQLRRDNSERGGWWWIINGTTFSVCKQKAGEPATIGPIAIPRPVFDAMIDWYQREQKILRRLR